MGARVCECMHGLDGDGDYERTDSDGVLMLPICVLYVAPTGIVGDEYTHVHVHVKRHSIRDVPKVRACLHTDVHQCHKAGCCPPLPAFIHTRAGCLTFFSFLHVFPPLFFLVIVAISWPVGG